VAAASVLPETPPEDKSNGQGDLLQ